MNRNWLWSVLLLELVTVQLMFFLIRFKYWRNKKTPKTVQSWRHQKTAIDRHAFSAQWGFFHKTFTEIAYLHFVVYDFASYQFSTRSQLKPNLLKEVCAFWFSLNRIWIDPKMGNHLWFIISGQNLFWIVPVLT